MPITKQKKDRAIPKSIARSLSWVRRTERPRLCRGPGIRIADFFSGCGGITLGIEEAARLHGRSLEPRLALDCDHSALAVYAANFPDHRSAIKNCDICTIFDGELGSSPSRSEEAIKQECGHLDLTVAGPPCQGHSDLNNSTRRTDPRNLLYLRAARAVEVLRPNHAIIENVPTVVHDSAGVTRATAAKLSHIGYTVSTAIVDSRDFGLPQRRRRHVLLASTDGTTLQQLLPSASRPNVPLGPFIAGLEDEPSSSSALTATCAKMTDENKRRVNYLFDNKLFDLPDEERPPCHRDKAHSYQSVYGRLRWNAVAPTITSGFGSMGQGRYIHPRRRRLISPHEAARIQGFPDFFDFSAAGGLTILRTMIANAVPPPIITALISAMISGGRL